MNLVIAILLLALVGALSLIAGVFLLVGLPWALIATSALLFAAAAILRRGITHG